MTEELPSSSQLLDDSLDRHLSSSIEEGKPHQVFYVFFVLYVMVISSLYFYCIKLLKEVEVLKGSHLKQIIETNLLEQELVHNNYQKNNQIFYLFYFYNYM